jgi:hypothetical protein
LGRTGESDSPEPVATLMSEIPPEEIPVEEKTEE